MTTDRPKHVTRGLPATIFQFVCCTPCLSGTLQERRGYCLSLTKLIVDRSGAPHEVILTRPGMQGRHTSVPKQFTIKAILEIKAALNFTGYCSAAMLAQRGANVARLSPLRMVASNPLEDGRRPVNCSRWGCLPACRRPRPWQRNGHRAVDPA